MRYDPETGERLFTEKQVREIVSQAIDVLKQDTLSGMRLWPIVNQVHENQGSDDAVA